MIRKRIKSLTEMFDEFILEKECTSVSKATIDIYKECYQRFIKEK